MKQSSIFHVTLMRILEPQAMSRDQVEAIHTACQQETERLKGTQFTASSLWYNPPVFLWCFVMCVLSGPLSEWWL